MREGRIALPDGMQYEILALPDREDMDLAVLRKIEQLVRQGATIVGRKPVRANGLTDFPQRDLQVRELADKIWGACDGTSTTHNRYGQGQVIWGPSLREVLLDRKVSPDFQFTSEQDGCRLDYIHRRTSTADIYFVRNMQSQPVEVQAIFRVADKLPEFWLPDTGEMQPCWVYRRTDDGVQLPLSLAPDGSLFVVFRDREASTHLVASSADIDVLAVQAEGVSVVAHSNGIHQLTMPSGTKMSVGVDELPAPLELSQPWELHFLSGRGAPEKMAMDQLESWTESEQERIKHYAGIVRYETTFAVPSSWVAPGRGVRLDLGRLWAVGRVRVNDHELGVVWKPPYQLDIAHCIKPGQNQLVVEVANTWSNRLVGDALLPAEQRIGRTNVTRSGTPGLPWKQVPLHESGLLGPVRLVPTVERMVPLK